jgi:hypothetical protein
MEEVQEIVYYDCQKGAETTLYLNSNGDFTGYALFFAEPRDLQEFFSTPGSSPSTLSRIATYSPSMTRRSS